jgi:methylation protein EvaC
LSKEGVFVFEEPYLGSMLKKTSYDQIYDAHVFMFSVLSVQKIFQQFNFDLIDVHPQITHGGSMRYVIAREGAKSVSPKIKAITKEELSMKMDTIEAYIKFKKQCEVSKENFTKKILKYKNEGKKICGYAATAKSSTVLNYCKIGKDTINFIADSTDEKVGKFSPGMHIPIVSIEEFQKEKPDVAILFAWNHKKEILEKEKNFSKEGGIWISHVTS